MSDGVRDEHISPASSLCVGICGSKYFLQLVFLVLLQVDNCLDYFFVNILRLLVHGELVANIFDVEFESVRGLKQLFFAKLNIYLHVFYLDLSKKFPFRLVVVVLF